VRHLLVTNDFPPKVGGIQHLLWELWRRLPPDEVTVLTTPYAGDAEWDARQPFRVVRDHDGVLLPTPGLARRIRALAEEVGAGVVVLDPALPLGLVGPRLGLPYAVLLHGAEITVPGRLPLTRPLLGRVLRGAAHVISHGGYPLAEAERAAGRPLPATIVPPGVDTSVFRPLDDEGRTAARRRLGLPVEGPLVVGVSRLVPRKGFDVLVEAAAILHRGRPDLTVAIAGTGRDRGRLEKAVARTAAPVRLLGKVPFAHLTDLYACGDVFAMLCRNRWGGLEQEGFGIVFVEAAAAGVPQVAGDSGGAAEAVVDGETGIVVRRPREPEAVARAIARLLDDDDERRRMAAAGRARAVAELDYDTLAARLRGAIGSLG
jgi:phosphatidylinositol alpha-1,6-mannosyltransferase